MTKSLNPNNPYVFNEYLFENSTDRYVYSESKIYFIRLANTMSIVVLGSLLACFVFFLIAKKSPDSFKSYRKMLLLTALVDSWMIIQSVLVQARVKNSNGIVIFTFTGLLPSLLGYSHYCRISILQFNASMIEIAVVPVQFYYRYYTLKKGKSPSIFRTFLWFLLSVSFCSITTIAHLNRFCPSVANSKLIDYGSYWHSEVPIPPLLVSQFNPNLPFYTKISGSNLQFCYFIATLFIAWMTMKILKEKLSAINVHESVKKVQKQLSRILFVQSLIPLFLLVIPRLVPHLFYYWKLDSNYYELDVIETITLWYPIFNLLSTIIFIEPYRRYCIENVPFWRYLSGRTTTVVILNPSNSY